MRTKLNENTNETIEDIRAEEVLTEFPELPAGLTQDAREQLKTNPSFKGKYNAMQKEFRRLMESGDIDVESLYASLKGNNNEGY